MVRLPLLLTILLSFAISAKGQEIKIDGNVKTVQVDTVVIVPKDVVVIQPSTASPVTFSVPSGGFSYQWSYPNGFKVNRKANVLEVIGASKTDSATISVEYSIVDFEAKTITTKNLSTTVSVGSPVVPPPPPAPVDPPNPPTPAPIPSPGGLRVLVIYEKTSGEGRLTAKQVSELNSADYGKYLDSKCVMENGTPGYRHWDVNIPGLVNAPKAWLDLVGRKRDSLPWIVISDNVNSWEGPLPEGGKILDKIKSVIEK